MVSIIEELWRRGHHPTIVYNTNGYDLAKTIGSLEGFVDVWLPDFKYSDDNLAIELSEAPGYSAYAMAALKTMMHQVGVTLQIDDHGIARRGIIVRHLVLPGLVQNSIGVLKLISEELSPNIYISLMSQYYPNAKLLNISHPKLGGGQALINSPVGYFSEGARLQGGRASGGGGLSTWNLKGETLNVLKHTTTRQEYETVLEAFNNFGLSRGWMQDYDSNLSYRPDFSRKMPFGEDNL
jgi:hypothetical protein